MKNENVKKLIFGCDSAGYVLKNKLIEHFKAEGYEIADVGSYSEESCHYPEFASKVCEGVLAEEGALGILICGTGIGMSIAANKYTGIRAAVCSDTYSARLTRNHNDSNVLCMGARVIGECLAQDVAEAFVGAEFEGGRHAIRVGMICDIEKSQH
ncbi:MAG: ribose 5-phosphate isomerase B [Clostridia bacterium]|nr:ribose 5-phosphate isomerase B [Clostridia bacterium]